MYIHIDRYVFKYGVEEREEKINKRYQIQQSSIYTSPHTNKHMYKGVREKQRETMDTQMCALQCGG